MFLPGDEFLSYCDAHVLLLLLLLLHTSFCDSPQGLKPSTANAETPAPKSPKTKTPNPYNSTTNVAELQRRCHSSPAATVAAEENAGALEGTWYL